MMNKHLSIITVTATLTACGGGGGGSSSDSSPTTPPDVLTGSFVDSPVKGLYYETPTQSGLTNENGEFNYKAGERVTFRIGNITLGGTTAAPTVTPFSLAGITPITKEAEIISSLSSANVNSFDRVLNIATLLQALDEDGDPENGIDLNDAHQKLNQDDIDLFVKATNFTKQGELSDIRRKLDISHRTSLNESVQHMYDSLGIEVESSQVASFASAINNRVVETISYEYDAAGNVTEQSTDTNNDGTPDYIKQFEYDTYGNVTRIENEATDTVEEMDYDANNKLIRRSIDKPNSDNDAEEIYSYISSFLIKLEVETGSGDTKVTEYDYTPSGDMKRYESDLDGDGQSDTVAEYEYDSNGNIASFVEHRDDDDVPEIIIAYYYDADGNRGSHSIDLDQDGLANSISSFEYDDNNNVIRYEQDRDNDGTPDYIEDSIYNVDNQRLQYRRDLDADGNWDMVAQYRYDINGNRTRMIEDSDGDGIVDKVWHGNYQAAVLDNSWDIILEQL